MMRITAAIRYACRATLVLALAMGSAAVAVSTAEPAGAAPAYQFCNPGPDPLCVPLQIMPSSGLTDGQNVQVLSTGNVLPSTTYQLEECQGVPGQQIYEAAGCDPKTLVTASTPATINPDLSGTLSTTFTVHLNINVNGSPVNCSGQPGCVIAVLGVPQYNPINFNGGGGGPPPGNTTETTSIGLDVCSGYGSTVTLPYYLTSPMDHPFSFCGPSVGGFGFPPSTSLGSWSTAANPFVGFLALQGQYGEGLGAYPVSVTLSPDPAGVSSPITVTTAPFPSGSPGDVYFSLGTLPPGVYTVTANFAGASSTYQGPGPGNGPPTTYTTTLDPSSISGILTVYGMPANGNFVIGDQNSSVGSAVTFWGAQWAKDNSLSDGSAPNSFKGFANTPVTAPTCGGSWSSDPGNSSGPPSSVPSYTEVIVSSDLTKSGSTISGNIVEIVIVKTNPGYGPDPGHAGTGTVVAVLCG
jgi:hypothetical protein